MRRSSRPHPVLFVAVAFVSSMVAAYMCAAVYLVALNRSLPPTDGAYGQTIAQMIADPFVWLVATQTATLAGLLIFPIVVLCLWRRDLLRCGLFVFGTTILAVAAITPASVRAGLVASVLVAVA